MYRPRAIHEMMVAGAEMAKIAAFCSPCAAATVAWQQVYSTRGASREVLLRVVKTVSRPC